MIRSARRPAVSLALSVLVSSICSLPPSFGAEAQTGAPVPSGGSAQTSAPAPEAAATMPPTETAAAPPANANPAAAPAPGANPTDASATSANPVVVLEGQLKVTQIDLQELREVGIDLKRVRQAASQLYEEVARQPVSIQEEPEMIGGTVIQIPVSFSGGGYLPPRKAWVDMAMANLKPFIEAAKGDVDDFTSGRKVFELPDGTKEKLQPHFKEWASLVDSLDENLQQLEPMTKGPYYDNAAIAKKVIAMDGQLKELDRVRKDVYKVIQKEAKVDTKEEKRDERKERR